MAEARTEACPHSIITIKLKPSSTIDGGDSFLLDMVAVDLGKQSAHFAKEHPPTLRVFRLLERQQGLLKLPQEFSQFVLSHTVRIRSLLLK